MHILSFDVLITTENTNPAGTGLCNQRRDGTVGNTAMHCAHIRIMIRLRGNANGQATKILKEKFVLDFYSFQVSRRSSDESETSKHETQASCSAP